MYINQLIKAVNKYGKTNFLKHQSLVFLQDECQASQKHFHSQLNQMMTEPNGPFGSVIICLLIIPFEME
jgi:hypothetical protein